MTLLAYIGWKATSLRNRVEDRLIERRLNIRTTGRKDVDHAGSVPYSTFAYWSIFRVLDRLELRAKDVLVDVGCGRGRVVCAAALQPLRRAVGVDIDGSLCSDARVNADQMRGRQAPIEIVNSPAQRFDYRDCTVMFLFNPFDGGTLREVMDSVGRSLEANPRVLRLAYVHPRHESVIARSGILEQYDEWPLRPGRRLKFRVSFWRSPTGAPSRSRCNGSAHVRVPSAGLRTLPALARIHPP